MPKLPKTIISLSIILLLISPFYIHNVLYAQQNAQPTSPNRVPSDLSLDLQLAQQNPAPDQQQIVQSETKKALMLTTTGNVITTVPQPTIAQDIQTQSKEQTINLEQTTSEQVVTVPEQVEVEVDRNGTPIPFPTQSLISPTQSDQNQPSNEPTETELSPTPNVVPGTNIIEPDDNAAPKDNSENPNLPAPTDAVPTFQPSITQVTDQQNNSQSTITPASGSTSTDNSGQSSPVPTQGSIQDTNIQPTIDTGSQPTTAPQQPALQDNSNNNQPQQQTQPSDNSNSGSQSQPAPQQFAPSNDNSGSNNNSDSGNAPSGDNGGSVQGTSISTNPIIYLFQRVKQKFVSIFFNIK